MDLPLDKKLWKIRTGTLGHRAVAGRGPWAVACEQALCLGKKIARRSTKGLFTGYVGRGPAFNKTPQNMVRVVFESADGSSYRAFELPRVKLQ